LLALSAAALLRRPVLVAQEALVDLATDGCSSSSAARSTCSSLDDHPSDRDRGRWTVEDLEIQAAQFAEVLQLGNPFGR
jgi:hypothetical protein